MKEQSATQENLSFVLDQLLDSGSLLEQFENLEVLYSCMAYASQRLQWPTTEEVAAISGLDIGRVQNVEERLGGTYEYALRTGLIIDRG